MLNYFDGSTSLPTNIDQNIFNNDPGFLQGDAAFETGNGGEFAMLFINSLTVNSFSNPDPPLDPPVVDEDGNLHLGVDGLASNAQINDGDPDLVTNNTVVGYGYLSEARFVQKGGLHSTDNLFVGGTLMKPQADGEYTLEDGILVSRTTDIGYHGKGVFTQRRGVHDTEVLKLGVTGWGKEPEAWGFGTYNLESGTLNSDFADIRFYGQGTFNQSGSTNTIGNQFTSKGSLIIGAQMSENNPDYSTVPAEYRSYGMYNLSGGTLTVSDEVIVGRGVTQQYYNYGGIGYFNQSGGISNIRSLIVGQSSTNGSGEGHVTVSDTAEMNADSIYVGLGSGLALDSSVASYGG